MNNFRGISDKFFDNNEDLKMNEYEENNNKYFNYNEDFEINFNEIFNPNELSDIRKMEEEEEKESNLVYFNPLFYNKEQKKPSKVNFNIPTNFTSTKIPNIFNLEVKNSLPPLESNLDFKNKNEILIEKEKKYYEDLIKKKRNEVDKASTCNTSQEIKKSGRKMKKLGESGKHNKYSDDNLIRKIKGILLNKIHEYCNNKIRAIYENKKGQKILLKINSEQRLKSKVEFNKNLLNKSIKDIFSENISDRYVGSCKNFNKNLINDLLNEKDEIKRIQFEKLFNLTFLDCLKHFRGSETFKELIGMKLFEESIKKFENDVDYDDYKIFLEYYTKYFEDIINIKKRRNSKSKNI